MIEYNNHNKQNPKPLIRDFVKIALDDTTGIVQHKTAIIKHIINQKFSLSNFYEPFIDYTNLTTVKYEPNVFVDCRTLNELKSLELYMKYFGSNIIGTYATLDSRPATFFNANQTNPDFWVSLDGKVIYQDDKSGMDMFKHSSKGSIGIVTYDQYGNNIQMTSNPIKINDIL